MHLQRALGTDLAGELASGVLAALAEVYSENCARHDPETIGDNNVTFGTCVSQNLRHLLEKRVTEDWERWLSVVRSGNAFALRSGDTDIHFYKAAPGSATAREFRFDASETKLTLVSENSRQMAFPGIDSPTGQLDHLVVVHFGDPDRGFVKAEIGKPIRAGEGVIDWEWLEDLSDIPHTNRSHIDLEIPAASEENDEFGLTLRRDEGEDTNTESA